MSDLFDDFMRELRRRQEQASGRRPSPGDDEGAEEPDLDATRDDDPARSRRRS
jgi:hypothetical protein